MDIMTQTQDPFAVLGIAPTLSLDLVKRAYFAALQTHPPHDDATGFQRLRAAYETLTRTGGLSNAYFATPLELGQELEQRNASLADERARATSAMRQQRASATAAARFVATFSKLTLAQADALLKTEPSQCQANSEKGA